MGSSRIRDYNEKSKKAILHVTQVNIFKWF